MAHLEVEPKPARPWWVGVLIVTLVILLAGTLIMKCNNDETTGADKPPRDSVLTP
jgi:hypothetical protein